MMTISSCNTIDHFNKWGNLLMKGKYAFWYEMDELLERFDKDDIKLLPAPRQKFWKLKPREQLHNHSNQANRESSPRYPLPVLLEWSSHHKHRY